MASVDRRRAPTATQPERTEASRQALIEATIAILANEGFRAATVARIQDASGLSRGLVGYHFGSKQKLMEAVVDYIRAEFQAQTTGERGGQEAAGLTQILEYFDSYLSRLVRDPAPAKVMLVLGTESTADAPELRQMVRNAYARTREGFHQMLETGIKDGTIRGDLDPAAHAGLLQGMIRGIVLQYLVDPERFDLDRAREAALASLRHDLGSTPSR